MWMLFRPNFCANCGEKVERTDWGIFTSRRFCPVCESEFKGQDLIPRAIVGLSLLVGIFGIGGYLKSGSAPASPLVTRQQTMLVSQPSKANSAVEAPVKTSQPPPAEVQSSLSVPRSVASQPPVFQQPDKKITVDEPSYYCGAETKKGTPCSRRVKGNIRCYQHKGMPAMLPPDKLRIG